MAKIKFPSYIKEGGGRMDDAVFVTRKGRSYMMPYREREYNPSVNQIAINQAFHTIAGDWKQLEGIIMDSWDTHAKDTAGSGYNLFVGDNVMHRRKGEPLNLCRGMGEEMLMNFTASAGANPGEITCEFLPVEQGNHVILFARKVTEPGVRCDITRHDAGANPSSPYTITGLENGAQYHIYAVVTDAQYNAALTVSQSVAALAIAG